MKFRNTVLAGVAVGALAAGITHGAVARAAPARAADTPAALQAAFDWVISSDDGFAVWNPLRGETDWFTGDATMIAYRGQQIDYSHDWGYPHGGIVAQRGSTFTPLRLWAMSPHYGWQPVPDTACPAGKVFWAGGVLYAPGARQLVDYGMCVNPSTGVPAGSYAATFDAATLAFRGLRALGFTEGLASAVPAAGGWWLPGSRFTLGGPSYADMAWVPAGDQDRPWDWAWTRDVVPDHLLPGGIFSVVQSGGRWLALTEPGDEYGGISVAEMSAAGPRGPWHATGRIWPLPVSNGVYAYSVICHGGYFTFAMTSPYGLRFTAVTL